MTEERIGMLRRSELFERVPERLLREIDRRLLEVAYPAGAVVFAQGEVGDAVYLVVSGTLALEVDGVTLLFRQPGECVGEFALIDDEPRSAAAVALTDVRLLRWERTDFQETLSRDAEVARGIFRMLTGKLREDVESKVRMQLERERWQQDLARAREIQKGMLPSAGLVHARVEVAGYCRPAAEVGGDYFDILEIDDRRLGLIIGDVTGHGFYSGLFVAMAKSCIHTQAEFSHAPPQVMAAMRRTLDLSIRRQLLMTCCYVLVELDGARLSYANAGHPYPYLYRAASGRLEPLVALDPILGALELASQPHYAQADLEWAPGDVLVMYSDGITEARDAAGEMFGHARLEAAILGLAAGSAESIKTGVLGAVANHTGARRPGDDLTLLVAKAR